MNIPGLEKPLQPLKVTYIGAYAQDEWTISDKLKMIGGVRMDVPTFGATGFANANANALTFRDEDRCAGAVRQRQAAGRHAAMVAPRRLQHGPQ